MRWSGACLEAPASSILRSKRRNSFVSMDVGAPVKVFEAAGLKINQFLEEAFGQLPDGHAHSPQTLGRLIPVTDLEIFRCHE